MRLRGLRILAERFSISRLRLSLVLAHSAAPILRGHRICDLAQGEKKSKERRNKTTCDKVILSTKEHLPQAN